MTIPFLNFTTSTTLRPVPAAFRGASLPVCLNGPRPVSTTVPVARPRPWPPRGHRRPLPSRPLAPSVVKRIFFSSVVEVAHGCDPCNVSNVKRFLPTRPIFSGFSNGMQNMNVASNFNSAFVCFLPKRNSCQLLQKNMCSVFTVLFVNKNQV